MKIKLQEALDLINSADVVRLIQHNGYVCPHISIDGVVNDPRNEVMLVTWEDRRDEYGFRVVEEGNNEVERDGHKLIMTDEEGDAFELHLFREVPILA